MLKELDIQNFAIIDKLTIEFGSGMTALTGETGAGKSIIIDALGLLVGDRGSTSFIRKGTDKAVIQGLFELEKNSKIYQILEDYGIEYEDNQLIVKRELTKAGKSVSRVNNQLVNLSTLKELGRYLVNIHGQNEKDSLLDDGISLVDRFGDEQHQKNLSDYQEKYENYRELVLKRNKFQKSSQELAQKKDMLEFQTHEIDEADLQPGEEEELTTQHDKMINFDKINNNLNESYEFLNESGTGIIDRLGTVTEDLDEIKEFDESISETSENVSSLYYSLQDLSADIKNKLDEMDYSPEKLNEIESRLNLIHDLEKKYGSTVQEVLDFNDQAHQELDTINNGGDNLDDLEDNLNHQKEELSRLADEITKTRQQIADELVKKLNEQLDDLYMDKSEIKIDIIDLDSFNEFGRNEVYFKIRTNQGEDFKDLNETVSGGEMSRILLAVETVLSRVLNVDTIIFDEIDTGVSGKVAQVIANKMYMISKTIQVISITHLPQVAAMSDHQYYIKKVVTDGRTMTTIKELTSDERIEIISEMIAGSQVTKLNQENARELLDLAEKEKTRLNG